MVSGIVRKMLNTIKMSNKNIEEVEVDIKTKVIIGNSSIEIMISSKKVKCTIISQTNTPTYKMRVLKRKYKKGKLVVVVVLDMVNIIREEGAKKEATKIKMTITNKTTLSNHISKKAINLLKINHHMRPGANKTTDPNIRSLITEATTESKLLTMTMKGESVSVIILYTITKLLIESDNRSGYSHSNE